MAQQLGAGFGLGGGAQEGLAELLRRDFEKREIARREAAEQERARSNRAQEGFLGQRLGLEERGLGLEERGLGLEEANVRSQISLRETQARIAELEGEGMAADQAFNQALREQFAKTLEGGGETGDMLGLAAAFRATGTGVQAPNLADPTGEVGQERMLEQIRTTGEEQRKTRATPLAGLSGRAGTTGGGIASGDRIGGIESMSDAQRGGLGTVLATLKGGVQAFEDLVASGAVGPGMTGKIQGLALEGQRKLGVNSPAVDAAQRLQQFVAAAPGIVKFLGDTGNIALTEQQVVRDALLPRVTDPTNIIQAKLTALGQLVEAATQGFSQEEFASLIDGLVQQMPATDDGTPTGQTPTSRFELIP